jgi:hypothetical protein
MEAGWFEFNGVAHPETIQPPLIPAIFPDRSPLAVIGPGLPFGVVSHPPFPVWNGKGVTRLHYFRKIAYDPKAPLATTEVQVRNRLGFPNLCLSPRD